VKKVVNDAWKLGDSKHPTVRCVIDPHSILYWKQVMRAEAPSLVTFQADYVQAARFEAFKARFRTLGEFAKEAGYPLRCFPEVLIIKIQPQT
jgi:hypothetical protein